MPDADLARRVEMLEETLKSLHQLPADVQELKHRVNGVEVQLLQLRSEMRGEFSAIRSEMATKTDLADGLAAVRSEMVTKSELATGLAAVRSATKADLADGLASVRSEIAAAKDELREDIAGMGRDLAQIIVDNQRELTAGLRTLSDGQTQLQMMVEDVRSLIQIRGEGNPSQ